MAVSRYVSNAISGVKTRLDDVDDAVEELDLRRASDSGLSPAGRHQFLQQHNDFSNPLAVGATPAAWTASFGTGATATSSPGVTDPDIGTAMSAKATYTGDFGHSINFGVVPASSALKNVRPSTDTAHVIHYVRVKVKIVSGPSTPLGLALHSVGQDGNGTNAKDTTIDLRDGVKVGDIVVLEGFDWTASNNDRVGGYVTLYSSGASGQSTVELRATEAQIVVEPNAEPHFGSGALNRWTWRGTANASGSDGFSSRESLNVKLPGGHGFQGTTQYDRQVDKEAIGPEREVLLLAGMGCTAHRGDLACNSGMFPQGGKPDWRAPSIKWYADYMDAMRRHGLKAVPIIGAPLGWMTTNGAADSDYSLRTLDPAHYDDFALLYTSLIDEWPDVISAVELFNEPNFTGVWGAAPDPALFSQHMLPLTAAIRAKHPDVKVVGTAIARVTDGIDPSVGMGAQTWLQGLYDAGLAQQLDAISIHPYSYTTSTGWDNSATAGYKWNFNGYINEILKVARANGDSGKKLWITENGANYLNGGTWNLRNCAIYNMLCRAIAARRPEIEAYFTHSFSDTYQQAAAQRGFGQFDLDKGWPRLGYFAHADAKLPEADWINLPPQNGWVPLDVNSVAAQYKVLPDGEVRVRGQIKGGSSATAAISTLPFKNPLPRLGWFPALTLNASTWGLGMIQVNGDGQFFFNQGGSTTGAIFDFTFTPGS